MMLRLAATERVLPPTLPRSSATATIPLASTGKPYRAVPRLSGPTPLFQAGRLLDSRPLRPTVCKAASADPPADAKDADKDKEKTEEKPKSRAALNREKFLAGVKIPDESQVTRKGIKKGDPNP